MTIFFRKTRPAWSVTRINSRSTWVANRGVRGVDFACLGWHLLDLDVRDHDELAAGSRAAGRVAVHQSQPNVLVRVERREGPAGDDAEAVGGRRQGREGDSPSGRARWMPHRLGQRVP